MTDLSTLFGSLQSIIWLLVVILIIAVIIWAVRIASAPRPRSHEPPPVVQQPIVQQPTPSSGLAPGWYPDQNDPNSMRYYDGRTWTSQTEPRR
ncbi:hypothetical protein AU193_08085 [Mycobacterium sp. GA-1285]|uniref:DUF2510 domain-containing protein n=1 Tax=Mycobacterium sp. GA-1285 TaxID=1772282 RepID=UPI00074B06C2|nr:DUF2510 domain-containing protein [Mycobacterium sp. GA-1285]KUI13989.1 hypothetical protein AU193_08085 [Mycobacterium sp. GA-1285]